MGPDTTTSTGFSKSYAVPMLLIKGSNWSTWNTKTLEILHTTKGVAHHLDRTTCKPLPLPSSIFEMLDDEEEEKLEKLEKCWDKYEHQGVIRAQIHSSVPDSVLIEVKHYATAKDVWDALCQKFEEKEPLAKVNIRKQIYSLKCEDESEVETHITKLMSLKEHLSSMLDYVDNSQYVSIILGSLPDSYCGAGQSLSAVAHIAGKPLTSQMTIDTILHKFH